ncbi:MAG: metallophosphoesterase [Pseudomonadota bacterium]
MRAVFLSDAHLDALDDPVQARLVAFLDALEADRLVLVGDLFHRWWSLGPGVFPAYVPAAAALERAARRGVVVDYLRGNHDFALTVAAGAELGLRVADHLDLVCDGLRVHAFHGDRAISARRYHAYHGLLRGPFFDLGMRLAGPHRAWAMLGRLAGSPVKQGRCPARLLEEQRAMARALLREQGADLVIMGHSHVPEDTTFQEGRYVNLGSFREPGSWAEIVDGEVRLYGS